MINYKSEQGSITLVVLVLCMFLVASVIGVQMYTQSKQVAVDREYRQIKANYEVDVNNMNEIYNNLNSINVTFRNSKMINNEIYTDVEISTEPEDVTINQIKFGWYRSDTAVDNLQTIDISKWTYVENKSRSLTATNTIQGNGYYYLCVVVNNMSFWLNPPLQV